MTIIARENQNPFRPHSAAALFRAGPPRGSDLLAWTPPSSVRDVGNSSSRSDSPPSAAATIRLAMPGTNTIALVSVIAGAVTAVSVPLITVVGQRRENRRRFEEDRLVKDFDELRILLDDCAQAINVYIGALERTENRYYESDTSDPGYYSEQLDYLRGRSATASHLNQRLVIRLGRQRPVVKAFGAAIAPLDAGYTQLKNWIERRQPADKSLGQRQHVASSRKEAYENYLDAAQALVGSPVKPFRVDDDEHALARLRARMRIRRHRASD